MLHTSDVTIQLASVDDVIAELFAEPVGAGDVRTLAPAAAGLYAWWASPNVLPALEGRTHPSIRPLRLLYIGLAIDIRSRLVSNHLSRSGRSTLRRTLAGLLLDEEQYRTRWTDRVVLFDEDERRLTGWMIEHLRVTWCEYPTPREIEQTIIRSLQPPLNVHYASGAARELVQAARRHYRASAGPRLSASYEWTARR